MGEKIENPIHIIAPEDKEITGWMIAGTELLWNFENDIVDGDLVLIAVLKEIEDTIYTFDFGTKQNSGFAPKEIELTEGNQEKHIIKTNGVQMLTDVKAGVSGAYLIFNSANGSTSPRGEASALFTFKQKVQNIEFKISEWSQGEAAKNQLFEIQIMDNEGKWIKLSDFSATEALVYVEGINAHSFRILIAGATSNARVLIDDLKVTTGKPQPKDETAPVIELSTMYLEYIMGDVMPDLGSLAHVTDNKDENIEIKFNQIDFTKVGTYTVTYTAKDRAGNEALAQDLIIVVRDLNIDVTVSSVSSNTMIIGFSEMLYLNGQAIKALPLTTNAEKLAFLNQILAPSVFAEEQTDASKIDITVTDAQLIITLNDGVFKKDAFKILDGDANGIIRIQVQAAHVYKTYDDKDMNISFDVRVKYAVAFANGVADYASDVKVTFQNEAQYLEDRSNDPIADTSSPVVNQAQLTYDNAKLILEVAASDDYLYQLEIDHTLDPSLEFSLYASTTNPYGSSEAKAQFEAQGVYVTYENGQWTIVIEGSSLDMVLADKGVTFYYVISDYAGNKFGSMSPTTVENTLDIHFVEVVLNHNQAQIIEHLVIVKDTMIELPVLSSEHQLFEGWFDNEAFIGEKLSASYQATQDIQLYAKWNAEAETVKVTYVTNQENVVVDNQVIAKNTELTVSNLTLTGYRFDGWFEDELLTVSYQTRIIEQDMTLYAKWTPLVIVEYVTNHTTFKLDAFEFVKGAILTLDALENIQLEGYYFAGWFTDSTLTTPFAEQAVNENLVLYADLKELNFTAIFEEINLSEETTTDLELPTTSQIESSATMVWSSNNLAITDTGIITRGAEDILVTLTLEVTLYGVKESKDYVVKVLKNTQEELTVEYVFTSKSWGSSQGNWISGKDGNQYQSGRGIQVTTGTTGATGTSDLVFSNVSSIEITYSTNASKGVGTIVTSIGDMTVQNFSVSTSGGTTNRSAGVITTEGLSGNINIKVNTSTNSIYLYSIKITYSAS